MVKTKGKMTKLLKQAKQGSKNYQYFKYKGHYGNELYIFDGHTCISENHISETTNTKFENHIALNRTLAISMAKRILRAYGKD